MTQARAQLDFSHENRVARITLAAPKANNIDVAMMADLDDARARLESRRDLAAIVLEAEGPNFSYGASVEEHLPDMITDTLTGFHRLIRGWLDLPAPTLAAVRGHCLGGGLELETERLAVRKGHLGIQPVEDEQTLLHRVHRAGSIDLIPHEPEPLLTQALPDASTLVSGHPSVDAL